MDEMTEKTAAVMPRTKRKKPVFASICLMLCAVCALIMAVLTPIRVFVSKIGELEMTERLEEMMMDGAGDTVAFAGMTVVFLALSISVLFDRKILSAALVFVGAFFVAGGISSLGLHVVQNFVMDFGRFPYTSFFDAGVLFTAFFMVAIFGVILLLARGERGKQGLAACAGPITLMMLVPIGICIFGEMDTLLGFLIYRANDVLSVVLSLLKLLFWVLYLTAVNRFCATADQKKQSEEEPKQETVSEQEVQS